MPKLTEFTNGELHLIIDTARQALTPHKCEFSELYLSPINNEWKRRPIIKFDRFQHIKDKYKLSNYKLNNLKKIALIIKNDFNINIPVHKILKFESKQEILSKLNKSIKKESKYDEFVRQIQLEKDVILTKKQLIKIWNMKSSGEHIKIINKYIDEIVAKRLINDN